jgi:hypothetical protein
MSFYRLDKLLLFIPTLQIFQRLRDAVWGKRRDNWQGRWFLHHCSAPSHTFLALTQLPHSPDLASTDTHLFLTLETGLKGTRFATIEDMSSITTAELVKIACAGSMKQECVL